MGLRRVVATVACLNLAYFGVEFATAIAIGSVSLLADSADFVEDAAVNFLVFLALAWGPARRAKAGLALSAVLLLPALAFLWSLWGKLQHPVPPDPIPLGIVGLGAMAVNLTCALLLVRHRDTGGSLTKAAFLSARNDVLANAAIVAAGVATLAWPSVWPDVIVGLAVAAMNLGAAHEVWQAARAEQATPPA